MGDTETLSPLWQRIMDALKRDLLAREPGVSDPAVNTARGLALVLFTQDLSDRAYEALEEGVTILGAVASCVELA